MGSSRVTVRVAGLSLLPRTARKAGLIEAAVLRAFSFEKSRLRGEISVIFVGRAAMRALNRQYLGHDDDTDVISFSHETVPGVPAAEAPVGDIYVSGWMAARQARERSHSTLREALTLVAHGALHILGHDDHRPRDKARMFKIQDRIIAELGV
jgi:probable rRNA maturation factor